MEQKLFTLSKIFGVVPFNHDQKNASILDYTLMLISPIIYVAAYSCTFIFSAEFSHLRGCPFICSIGHHMLLHLGFGVYITSYLLSFRQRKFYMRFAISLNEIDGQIKHCGKPAASVAVKRFSFQFYIGAIGLLLFLLGFIFDAYNLYSMVGTLFLLICFSFIYPYLIASLVQAQFITLIHAIALRFTEINKVLEIICDECESSRSKEVKLYDIETDYEIKNNSLKENEEKSTGKDSRNDTERYLVDVFKLHDKLCQIGVQTNGVYSLQVVSYMTAAFTIIVFGIFIETKVIFLVWGLNKYLDYMATSYVVWGVILSLIAYIVLRLCCRAQKESKRSALLIHEIMQKKPAFMLGNDIFYNRMKGFTLQYLHWENYFHFNGIGLFELDYTFIFSAISAATSYLIVLLQFDLSSSLEQ